MLTLTLSPHVERLTTLESLSVRLTLRNDGAQAVTLPYLIDQTDAVTFRLTRDDGAGERLMTGYTGQEMASDARIDAQPSLLALAPGETWSADIDLGNLHQLIPAGRFTLRAEYAYAPEQVAAVSEACAIEVGPAPLISAFVVEERSMIDSLVLLLRAEVRGQRRTYIRQHTLQRPLAAWYATEVVDARDANQAVLSTARYPTAPVADAAVGRFVIWRRGQELQAQFQRMGRPAAGTLSAVLAPDLTLSPWADHDIGGGLHLYARRSAEVLAFAFGAGGLRPLFSHAVPEGADVVVRGMDTVIDVVAVGEPGAPVVFSRLDVSGRELVRRDLFPRPPGRLLQLAYEPRLGMVRALFAQDGEDGLLAVLMDIEGEAPREQAWRGLKGRAAAREGAFAADKRGGMHLLSADARSLAYTPPRGSRMLIGQSGRGPEEGGAPFPFVTANRSDVYLGSHHLETGYRFWEFQPHNAALKRYDSL